MTMDQKRWKKWMNDESFLTNVLPRSIETEGVIEETNTKLK